MGRLNAQSDTASGLGRRLVLGMLVLVALVSLPSRALAQDSVELDELSFDRPTPTALGVVLTISGDRNGNAEAAVLYRQLGSTEWRPAHPLHRVGQQFGSFLAGTVFDLAPDAEYEISVTLTDPDGGGGEARAVSGTRRQPTIEGRVLRHVSPGAGGGSGALDRPFLGLAAADAAAQPGDFFLLSPGSYQGHTFETDGTANAPIVYVGNDLGTTFVDKVEADRGAPLAATAGDHTAFARITFRGSVVGGDGLIVRGCVFQDAHVRLGGVDAYVCDNEFDASGLAEDERWTIAAVSGQLGEAGATAGHVICHNKIRNYKTGIRLGHFEGIDPYTAIDIYGNDIAHVTRGIEILQVHRNVRISRNSVIADFTGIMVRGLLGGPVYVTRNEVVGPSEALQVYGLITESDPSNPWPIPFGGLIVVHNTMVGEMHGLKGVREINQVVALNNLFYSTEAPALDAMGTRLTFDYNGWASNVPIVRFNDVDYDTLNAACDDPSNLSDFCAQTGQSRNAITIDRSVWVDMPVPLAYDKPPDFSFDAGLVEGSSPIDRGTPLANFNDGFASQAPDLGAREAGDDAPSYGPRPPLDIQLPPIEPDKKGCSGCRLSTRDGAPSGIFWLLVFFVARRRR